MKKCFMLLAVASTAACSPIPMPLVEKEGVTVSQMNKDLAECKNSLPAISLGTFMYDCMAAKGYDVISGYRRRAYHPGETVPRDWTPGKS